MWAASKCMFLLLERVPRFSALSPLSCIACEIGSESEGLKVSMVNGKQTRNLPGRKTDMKDCQWGATLHAHGLLQAGFVPPAQIRRLQDYLRLRGDHLSCAAACVQHQQKALERMNVKLHDVISSLVGESGIRIVEAIL